MNSHDSFNGLPSAVDQSEHYFVLTTEEKKTESKRQNPKVIEATSVKHQEKDRIEPRVERTWLLCGRSTDVTDV